jgi:ornithine cyclodeaminase/alanine dehydrogenase-like protein (mu-crystallin family)
VTRLRVLSEEDVRAAIDTDRALDLARKTLVDQAQGGSILASPPTMSLDAKGHGGPAFKFRAATVGFLGVSGIRLLSRRTPTGSGACEYCAIYRHEGTAISALVSESWLSRIRTAAFGAVVIERLVKPGPLVVALFGTGRISHEIVPMLARLRRIAELRVQSRRTESMAQFVAQHASKVDFPMRAEPDRRRMVEGADLVITLTESPTPLVFPEALKPGVVVCSMGSYNELDFGVLRASQRFIVDDVEYASSWGDGGAWIAQGHLTREQFIARVQALACEVVAGTKPGRLEEGQRIVAIIQGMAIGDIAFAAHALNEAEREDRGMVVDLP